MKITDKCKLFLRDIYLYDITSCHYSILENAGFDVSFLEKDNKKKRNIQIGMLMRDNSKYTSLLHNTTNSIINEYISINKLKDEEIVTRQYDGIIVTRPLNETSLTIKLELQSNIMIFISSFKRNSYISFDGHNASIKGVSNRYPAVDSLYHQFLSTTNFINKSSVFKQMQKLKDLFLKSDNPNLFCIPSGDDSFIVYLKEFGDIKISKQTSKILDTDDIDKEWYFNFYIKPFTQSLVLEFS